MAGYGDRALALTATAMRSGAWERPRPLTRRRPKRTARMTSFWKLVGAANFGSSLRTLNLGGCIAIIFGAGPGTEAKLDIGLLLMKRAIVRASTLRARPLEDKALATRAVEREVLPHVATGKISVPIAAAYPLAEAAAAYDAFKTPGKLGKIILLL